MKSPKSRLILNRQTVVILLLTVVSLLSAFSPYFRLDLQISKQIQSINSQIFTNIMWFVSAIGNQPIMVLIVGITSFLLFLFKKRTEAVFCSLASAGSALSGSFLKIIVDRPRPSADLVHVSVWLSDKSFPSNHVLVFTVLFGFLLYLLFKNTKHRLGNVLPAILLIILISTVGISRIYLGAHWASDVLGGYLLGSLWLILTIRLYNSYNGKR
jgi:membrane-associated phospholipid phosphatase